MTSQFAHSKLPWKQPCKEAGLSTLLFALPAMHRTHLPKWKRAACLAQALVAFLSDYVYAGQPHLSHGFDRWLAMINVVASAYHNPNNFAGLIALLCLYLSMKSIQIGNRHAYNFWHTCWHVLGSYCIYLS